jgi:hypothetical protein
MRSACWKCGSANWRSNSVSSLVCPQPARRCCRRIGRISKRGDRYLRMLLTHGARAVLNAANLAVRMQRPIDPLRRWALQLQQRSNHNKAVCARQQACSHLLRGAARSRALRHHAPEPQTVAGELCNARLKTRIDPANACPETHRPSWLTGPPPHRSMPITTVAVPLPFAAIGTAMLQISISARDIPFPLQMPDIRLQANSRPPSPIDQSLLAGGVHIGLLALP